MLNPTPRGRRRAGAHIPILGGASAALAQESGSTALQSTQLLEDRLGGGERNPPLGPPTGSRILFRSGLAGGGLMTITPEGDFPRRVPVMMGGAGHFLASSSPRYSPDGD